MGFQCTFFSACGELLLCKEMPAENDCVSNDFQVPYEKRKLWAEALKGV